MEQLSVELTPEAAAALRQQAAPVRSITHPTIAQLLAIAQRYRFTFQPEDADGIPSPLDRYLYANIPAEHAAAIISELQACPAVAAAFVKPQDEQP